MVCGQVLSIILLLSFHWHGVQEEEEEAKEL
jgi:hypothetical protein